MKWNVGRVLKELHGRDFIQSNYVPYEGDESFLASPTEATKTLWAKVMDYMKKESQNNGVYDVDTERVSTITSHAPGYIDKNLEKIVGIQTDTPLKRAIFPGTSLEQTKEALESYGYKMNDEITDRFRVVTYNIKIFGQIEVLDKGVYHERTNRKSEQRI